MSDLYLNPGESLILTTNRISVNFIPFELMLTNVRLILLDTAHDRFRPQVIPLTDIFSVNGGTVSTGEPIIRITITDSENDGSHIPIDFIFSQVSNQKRKAERDAWLMTLMEKLVDVRQEKVMSGIHPSRSEERPPIDRWIAPEILHPLPLVTGPDLPAASANNTTEIPESPKTMAGSEPEPGTVSHSRSEPGGPVEQVTKEKEAEPPAHSGDSSAEPVAPEEPEPTIEVRSLRVKTTGRVDLPVPPDEVTVPVVENHLPAEPMKVCDKENESGSWIERSSPEGPCRYRPDMLREGPGLPGTPFSGEAILHDQHPVSRIEPAEIQKNGSDTAAVFEPSEYEKAQEPLDNEDQPGLPVVNWPVIREGPQIPDPGYEESGAAKSPGDPHLPPDVEGNIRTGALPVPETPTATDGKIVPDPGAEIRDNEETGGSDREVIPPVVMNEPRQSRETGPRELTRSSSAGGREPEGPAVESTERIPRTYRTLTISIVVLLSIVLVITVWGILFVPLHQAPDIAPVPTIVPPVTQNSTPTVKPVVIPDAGVWIHIIYPGSYYGRVGNPSEISDIAGTGDQFHFIRNSGSLLQGDIRKQDNSGDTLTVEVLNNGTRVYSNSVRAPMGTIHFLIDTETGKPPASQS